MGESDPLDGLNSENRNEAERKGGISVFGFLNETESCGDWEGMTFSYPSQLSRKTTMYKLFDRMGKSRYLRDHWCSLTAQLNIKDGTRIEISAQLITTVSILNGFFILVLALPPAIGSFWGMERQLLTYTKYRFVLRFPNNSQPTLHTVTAVQYVAYHVLDS